MKKVLTNILGGAFALTLFVGLPMVCSHIESHYDRAGYVVEVNDGVAVIEDKAGYTWEWESDDFTGGEKVVMLMYDNLTMEDIFDDVIKSVELVD